ncbi:MAG: GntR family transcriptional regulator [Chloroflexi bacterium]|nr:GntR family transcriptional regulator [Chloroflexota bacterium]
MSTVAITTADTTAEAPAPLRRVGQRRETLADLAYKELLEAIELRRLEAGQPLGLDQLARQLGMSRTPVNVALSRLHAEGLVSYNGHLGFVVRALSADDLRDIYDLRVMCELHAVATGLLEAPDEHIQRIAATHAAIAAGTTWSDPDAFRRFWDLDGRFHRLIVRLSPNDQLQEWFGRLNHHIHAVRLALRAPTSGAFDAMLREHAAIVAALERRDVEVAQGELRRHIVRSRDVSLARQLAEGQP